MPESLACLHAVRRFSLGAIVLLSLAPSFAQAHAVLLDSTPAPGGSMAAGRSIISLRFNSRVDHKASRLTLTAPGGTATVLPIDAASPVDTLSSGADLQAGAYTLHWQVLALDGHLTRGAVPFTVTAVAPGSGQ